MSKTCPKCKENKTLEEFYIDRSKADGHMSYCKKCDNKRPPRTTSAQRYSYVKKCTQKTHTYRDNLKEKGCVVCGYNRCLTALAFHHVIPDKKNKDVCAIKTIRLLKREAAKCLVLCANCHAEVHAGMIDVKGLNRATYCEVHQLAFN